MSKREQGLSLVELLVAVAILAVAIIPMVRILMFGLQTGNRANKLTIATNLARDLTEEIRIQAFAEEFVYPNPSCDRDSAYPKTADAQCFGLEAGETVDTATNGGRIDVFDDADDYDGWCRGDCNDTPDNSADDTFLETYDGRKYNGEEGYPAYYGFTRRVRVHNLDAAGKHLSEFDQNPFKNSTSEEAEEDENPIRRYNFDNWSAIVTESAFREGTSDEIVVTDGDDPFKITRDEDDNAIAATGLTPLKRVEVIVTYNGPTVSGIEVSDVSYVVLPLL